MILLIYFYLINREWNLIEGNKKGTILCIEDLPSETQMVSQRFFFLSGIRKRNDTRADPSCYDQEKKNENGYAIQKFRESI